MLQGAFRKDFMDQMVPVGFEPTTLRLAALLPGHYFLIVLISYAGKMQNINEPLVLT